MSWQYSESESESESGWDTGSESDTAFRPIRRRLRHNISSVRSAGTFATTGVIENLPVPGVTVDQVGHVWLPLSEDNANSLIRTSRQAPFGKGTETVVDVSVRKTWEIDASRVTFANPQWQACLRRVVENVCKELGTATTARSVRVELYKMLIYETGAMFKPHRDTEKGPGMFGTLVICLPSHFAGGRVSLQHGIESRIIDTSSTSAFQASYIAWYADVLHEVQPITAGFRWVLTYNLVQVAGSSQSASGLVAQTHGLNAILADWHHYEMPSFFYYSFEHRYTSQNFDLAQLKGNDSPQALHVLQACAKNGSFYFFLANAKLVADYDNREEEEAPRYAFRLTMMKQTDGPDLLDGREIHISESYVLSPIDVESREHDRQTGGEYLGNSYDGIEKIYKDSGLIVVSKATVSHFLLAPNINTDSIRRLLHNIAGHGRKTTEKSAICELLVLLCDSVLKTPCHEAFMGPVAETAVFLENETLFRQATARTSIPFDSKTWQILGSMIDLRNLVVSEQLLIEALTKSRSPSGLHNAIKAFSSGLAEKKRSPPDIIYHNGWLDTVLFQNLDTSGTMEPQDAFAMVDIIMTRGTHFRQFVAYQCVRQSVQKCADRDWKIALAFYICQNWNRAIENCRPYLQMLFDRVLDENLEQIDLSCAIENIRSCMREDGMPWGNPRDLHAHCARDFSSCIKTFVRLSGSDRHSLLLDRFQNQASELSKSSDTEIPRSFMEALKPMLTENKRQRSPSADPSSNKKSRLD